jgi:peptide/nickel transport system substrate-binding protein
MKRFIKTIIFLPIVWIIFCGCNKSETTIEMSIKDEYPASGKDNFVILNYSADPIALCGVYANDPDAGTFYTLLYDSLVYVDFDGNLKPGLAVSWKQIDGKTYQFKLRKGVKFHNGQECDAHDVKYTFDLHLNPEVKSVTGLIWNNPHLVHIKEIVVVDKYTIKMVLHRESGIIYNQQHMFGSIYPKDYPIEKMKENPIGTGPYKFVKWDKGKQIILTRNDHYWNPDIPKIKNLVFKIMPVEKWHETIIAGEADFVMHLAGKYRKKIEADAHTKIMERPVLSSVWISLKNKGPLKDIRVRKAMNHAVDMESIIRYAEYGKGVVCASMGRKGEFGFNENLKPYEYDLKKAKTLMKAAGYEKGFKLSAFATDMTETVMQMVKEDLMDIHIELELEIVPTLQYIERAPFMAKILGTESAAEYDIAAWIVDNPVINMLFNCDTLMLSIISHTEHTPYNYPEYEAKHNWANVSDPKEHEKRLKALDKFIHDNAYFLFTYQRVLTSAVRKNVHIKKLNLNGHLEKGMLTETTKD